MKKAFAAAAAVLSAAAILFFVNFETPKDHYDQTPPSDASGHVSVTVSASTIANEGAPGEKLRAAGLVPSDGVIAADGTLSLSDGDTAFDALSRVLSENEIPLDYTSVSKGSVYVKGINNIYEYDCGDLSGWMYSVNGVFPTVPCSEYELSDGDSVMWLYTCDLGRDVGDTYYSGVSAHE